MGNQLSISVNIQRTHTSPPPAPTMRQVRKWGDPVMLQYGFDVNAVGTSNFQAVRSYNKVTGFGAVTNWLYINHDEVVKLQDMQILDAAGFTTKQKMEWLCSYRGSLYMYDNESDYWQTAPRIRWGTLELGGNVVQVEDYEMIRTQFGPENDKRIRDVLMARLVGFQPEDWSRPLNELVTQGLIHRVYCAYKNNQFGDSPKGIVYSPFYSPKRYEWNGQNTADALYIPEVWLEPKS